MITPKALIGNVALLVGATFPQLLWADSFTAADVLEWSEEEQDSFFQTSVLMVGIVAAQTDQNKHIADCIDAWHGGGTGSQPARSAQIREGMMALSDYHPQVVVLAVIQKECGKFQ